MFNHCAKPISTCLPRSLCATLTASLITCMCLSITSASSAAEKPVDPKHAEKMAQGIELFTQTVKPILAQHCLDCHGGEKTKGEFDLTTREKLIEGGFEAEGIVPNDHKKSQVFKLISHLEKPHMPHKAPKLKPDQITAIAKWIDLGAPYDKPLIDKGAATNKPFVVTDKDRQFWSFQPIKQVQPKTTANDNWSRTPLDRIILAKLQTKNLQPNNIDTKRKLIRRAYIDLIGLPPTPEQIDAFISSNDPKAYNKLIDQLLANEQFGPRWARHWLDVARFGESDGYEQDYDRKHAYHYRDFVIKAFNQDMPFNQFVQWQIAGDEIEPDNPLAMMATGFLTAGTFPTQLTEREFEQARYDQLDDMTNTTMIAFLGLTVGCARCHDHKFDPISNREYYQIVSTFTTTIRNEINLPIGTPKELADAKTKRDTEIATLEQQLSQWKTTKLPNLFDQYIKSLKSKNATGDGISPAATPWHVLDIKTWNTAKGTKFAKQSDGSLLKVGKPPATDTYTFTAETKQTNITGIRLEALTHSSFPRKGPGLASNGNFCLSKITVEASPLIAAQKRSAVKLVLPRSTHQQNTTSLSLAASLNTNNQQGWAVDQGGIGKDQAAAFAFEKPIGFDGGTRLTITLTFEHNNKLHAIGRPRLSVTSLDAKTVALRGKAQAIPTSITSILNQITKGATLDEKEKQAAMLWFASSQPAYTKIQSQLQAKRNAQPALRKAKVQISSEGLPKMNHHANGRGFPHFYPQTHFLNRGDPNQKEGIATQNFLQVLMPKKATPKQWQIAPPKGWRTSYRRRSLANWITDTKQGAGNLLARVIVNRLWHHHMGTGIVTTPNDFGFQGERPTHPQLLDYLASELIKNNWKLKPIHKLIMTSAAYMQRVDYHSNRAAADPGNQLYWRRNMKRLEAEVIRDSMLQVAGKLDPTLFGPGSPSASMNRRSLFFFMKRSRIMPVMQIFDLPEPLVSQGARPTTTIAPQALHFMNDPQIQAYSRAFASKIKPAITKSTEAAVTAGYQLAIGRPPSAKELTNNTTFINEQTKAYTSAKVPNPTDAALADFCQILFCLNEFVYVE